jgi:hypothetical protein
VDRPTDAPAPTGGFELSQDEFITGRPKEVAQTIIPRCAEAIPLLRAASVPAWCRALAKALRLF